MISLDGLTKAYPGGRGVFDLTLDIAPGEVFGLLGPNGAGKSTTIRHLMGFLRPDAGAARIRDLDCWADAPKVQAYVGYVPGEIGFPDEMTGAEFLDLMAGLRGSGSGVRRKDLCERFELDPLPPLRRMSKGTKQKVALVAGFMHEPAVLILDEPTSGLDPLMQRRFLELVAEEQRRGATMLMSSHAFPEVERVADRVGILRAGRLVAVRDVASLRQMAKKVFTVTTASASDHALIQAAGFTVVERRGLTLGVEVTGDYDAFIRALARCKVRALDIHPLDLEQIFMHFYSAEEAGLK